MQNIIWIQLTRSNCVQCTHPNAAFFLFGQFETFRMAEVGPADDDGIVTHFKNSCRQHQAFPRISNLSFSAAHADHFHQLLKNIIFDGRMWNISIYSKWFWAINKSVAIVWRTASGNQNTKPDSLTSCVSHGCIKRFSVVLVFPKIPSSHPRRECVRVCVYMHASRFVAFSIGLFSVRSSQHNQWLTKKKQLRLFEYIFKCFSCVRAVIKYKMYVHTFPIEASGMGAVESILPGLDCCECM